MGYLDVLKFVAALGLVLSLIGGCAWAANRLNLWSGPGRRSRTPRLKIKESLTLDARHRLMIVASDDREHVLLLGPSGDLVVESRPARPNTADVAGNLDETIVPLIKESGA